jgi:Na+-translocating ferredoxin:NAD+ oxidoreductase subunit B
MDWLFSVISLGGLGLLCGTLLVYAARRFWAEDSLPAVKSTAALGTAGDEPVAIVAVIKCRGGQAEAKDKYLYYGVPDCQAADLLGGGSKACGWGCLGYGTCLAVCPAGALSVDKNRVVTVDDKKCTGCGQCALACPKGVIDFIPRQAHIFLACANHDQGAGVTSYCAVGCTTCGHCVPITPSGTVVMDHDLPRLLYGDGDNFVAASYICPQNCFIDKVKHRPRVFIGTRCNGCGECVQVCPVPGAIMGVEGKRYKVNAGKCIGCGLCIPICKQRAVATIGALGYIDDV